MSQGTKNELALREHQLRMLAGAYTPDAIKMREALVAEVARLKAEAR